MCFIFFLMIRRPPRSTLDRSSAASDVYKRQVGIDQDLVDARQAAAFGQREDSQAAEIERNEGHLSLIHISEPTRPY